MSEYIERGALKAHYSWLPKYATLTPKDFDDIIDAQTAADVEPVVRCAKCKYGTPLKAHADGVYGLHCTIGRGEEVRNVWHKYSKHYEDYSLVDADGFCNDGRGRETAHGKERER